MKISEKEVLRYLGFRQNAPDEATLHLIDEVETVMQTEIQPKSIYGEFPLVFLSKREVKIGDKVFDSEKLCRHLRTCERVLVFAATLGAGADRLLRRYSATDSAKAAVAQAVLAAATESYCDEVCAEIAAKENKNGWYLRPRFSPGYGDMALTAQKDLFSLLEITKRIGLVLTESCLMLPTKSVTAFIGLTREAELCDKRGCALCDNTDCAYRKEEENGIS
ncbi:MAG: vitamin B12 dependent-methionine synthase activation domain-containing protein [Candidatus Fimenecus sp.]